MAAYKVIRQVNGKYPALLFKQQLAAYVEKIYGMIRDSLKKELSSFLSQCIQVKCFWDNMSHMIGFIFSHYVGSLILYN